jgi:hypothetical protein
MIENRKISPLNEPTVKHKENQLRKRIMTIPSGVEKLKRLIEI